jgi:hypothetical protein
MSGSSFDPMVLIYSPSMSPDFDTLIDAQDISEQVPTRAHGYGQQCASRRRSGIGRARFADDSLGFRSITEAQREVFALHEIAQPSDHR